MAISYFNESENYFSYFTGRITHLNPNDGFIDENIYFTREMVRSLQIQEGMTVKYLARKISDDLPIQVYVITEIVKENWGNVSDTETEIDDLSKKEKISTHERILLGRVVKRERASVVVETNESHLKHIQVELNEIACNFLPMFGDEVSLLCLFSTDISSFNLSGYMITCYNLKPADKIEIVGTITRFPKGADYGTVKPIKPTKNNNNDEDVCLFYLDALQNADNLSSKPDIGSTVIATAIRCHRQLSDYRTYLWRCINIISKDDNINSNSGIHAQKEKRQDLNRNGIRITSSDILRVKLANMYETKYLTIIVENTSKIDKNLSRIDIKEQIAGSQVQCEDFNRSFNIPGEKEVTFNVCITAKLFGISHVTLNFLFDNQMTLDRVLEIEFLPKINNKSADPIQSNKHSVVHNKEYTKNLWQVQGDVVSGVRVKTAPLFVINRLQSFEVSQNLIQIVLDSSLTFREIDDKLHTEMPYFNYLDFDNYKKYFHGLIHLEEIALDHEFRKYDRELAYFRRDGEYLALKVENVFESRPSLIIGDKVIALDPFQENAPNTKPTLYEGFIHKLKKDHVLIKFNEIFHNRYGGEDYRLYFKFSRSKFIKQLNAVDRTAKNINRSKFFPKNVQITFDYLQFDVSLKDGVLKSNHKNKTLPWFNTSLNIVQKEAITQILRGETRPMPYIIFGPPGTGKTSTLIELILQTYKNIGGSRIIVCAPSNSAANLITQRLFESKQLRMGEFVRIVGINSIEREQVPDELHPYCAIADIATPNTVEENTHIRTSSGLILNTNSVALSAYKIIISTCMSFGSLMCMKFNRTHFTHVIIDEAGQCLETEAMIPISLLNSKDHQIVLAGDPMQIGPIVLSKFAKIRGFDKSFLVRLLDRTPYKRFIENNEIYNYDERVVTKLLYNYRSLPSILSSFNELFYDSELIPTISPMGSEESKILKRIQAQVLKDQEYTENYGILFNGIRGREEQIAESTSWRNLAECAAVSVFYMI